MGLMDKAKKAVQGRSDQIAKGVDAAAKQVDKRTGGKYADKVAKGADRVKSRARDLDEQRSGGQTPDGGSATDPARGSSPTDPRGGSPTDPARGGSPTDPRGGPATDPARGGSPTDPGAGGTTPAG